MEVKQTEGCFEYIRSVAEEEKSKSLNEKDFIERCVKRGLPITFPETFLRIYYYKVPKPKKLSEASFLPFET